MAQNNTQNDTAKIQAQTDATRESDAVDKQMNADRLQAFFNDAYISERERLDSMFGKLDLFPAPEQKIVYRDPDPSLYVPVKNYKKKAKTATAFIILFLIALIAAGVLAYLKFFA
jgi:hypothetical protein